MKRPTVVFRVAVGSADEDRLEHRANDRGDLFILADGAGGLSGGRQAAEGVVAQCRSNLSLAADAIAELGRLDIHLAAQSRCGECTGVLVVVRDGHVFGASVGDSGAWLLRQDSMLDLTRGQLRKPLLGSGDARPVGFGPIHFSDRLLIASDGLLKYVPRDRIRQLARLPSLQLAADELIAAARLPSGRLQDDIALILVDA